MIKHVHHSWHARDVFLVLLIVGTLALVVIPVGVLTIVAWVFFVLGYAVGRATRDEP